MAGFDLYEVTNGMTPEEIGGAIGASNKTAFGVPSLKVYAAGDSRINNSFIDQFNKSNRGLLTWLTALTGVDFKEIYNYAVSGATLSEIEDQIDLMLNASELPDVCIVNGGTNTFAVDYTAGADDRALSVMVSIITKLRSSGIVPIVEIDTPRADSSWVSQSGIVSARYNSKLRNYCYSNGVVLADHERDYIDDTGEPASGFNVSDGIHQSVKGGIIRAKRIAEAFNFGTITSQESPRTAYDVDLSPFGSIIDGYMTGTGGTNNSGSGTASGVVADNWQNRVTSGAMTATASIEVRNDGPGNYQVIELTNTAGSSTHRFDYNSEISTSGFSSGDKFRASFDMFITSASGEIRAINAVIYDFDGSATFGQTASAIKEDAYNIGNVMPEIPLIGNKGQVVASEIGGVFVTPTIEIGDGITSDRLLFRIETTLVGSSSFTYKVGNVRINRVDA